jgi:ribonuclease PH
VLQADGGTRTAAITGACIAVSIAFNRLLEKGKITRQPLKKKLAAVSVGIVKGETLLDLCYTEDAAADVDSNIVLTEDGEFVEIQGSGEEATFTEAQLHSMLEYGRKGIKELVAIQDEAITSAMKPAEGKDLQKLAEFFGKR